MPDKPYKATIHYDPSRPGIWIGMGYDMNPVCGHRDYIAVTDNPSIVDCGNCLPILAKEQAATT